MTQDTAFGGMRTSKPMAWWVRYSRTGHLKKFPERIADFGLGNLLFVGRTRRMTQDTAVGGMRTSKPVAWWVRYSRRGSKEKKNRTPNGVLFSLVTRTGIEPMLQP